jgi:hypothetical protein
MGYDGISSTHLKGMERDNMKLSLPFNRDISWRYHEWDVPLTNN